MTKRPFQCVRSTKGSFVVVIPCFLLAGCSGVILGGSVPSAIMALLPGATATSAAQYRAYGDSITFGATLKSGEKPYPAFIAEDETVTYVDNALSHDQACDVAARQIFPHRDSPTLETHPKYSLLIGTNDVSSKGVGSYEAVFRVCHQAAISWLAIPAEHKVLATGTGVTMTGAGGLDADNNWNAWTTGAKGSSVSFTITTVQDGPIYAWPRIIDGNRGTYTYSLDGVVVGSGAAQTIPSMATLNGTSDSLGFLRLPVVPAGTHVVTFTQTSEGTNGVSVVGVGTPTKAPSDLLPTVLVGTIPYQLYGSDCNSSRGPCQNYIEDIESDVRSLSNDGLDVRLFDTRNYMFGYPFEMNDPVHPSEYGQYELSHSIEASWQMPATN